MTQKDGPSLGTLDVVVLDGIGRTLAGGLRSRGVHTVADLTTLSAAEISATSGGRITPARAARMLLHARAMTEGRAFVLAGATPPPPALLLIDLESSADRHDDPWLVGLLGPGEAEVRQVESLDPACHGEVIEFVDAALRAVPGARPASWGSYDRDVLRKCCSRLRVPRPGWLSDWFDAHNWVRRTLVPPCPTYGIKALAGSLGFAWQHGDVDGYTVGTAYSAWRDRGVPFPRERFREYNRDDVWAMARVMRRTTALVESA